MHNVHTLVSVHAEQRVKAAVWRNDGIEQPDRADAGNTARHVPHCTH